MLIVNRRAMLALTLVTGAIGCAGVTPPRFGDGSLRTDRGEYALRNSGELLQTTIRLTFVNNTRGVVHIPSCKGPNPPILEKWVDGRWVRAYAPVVPACLGPPVEIAARATYTYEYKVFGAPAGSNFAPRFEVSPIAGTYRAVWDIYSGGAPSGPVSELLPLASRVSNSFEIRD